MIAPASRSPRHAAARGLLVLAGVLVVLAGLVIPAHASAADNYVALGDSYSSGVGTDSYIASSGSCQRSTLAYPALYAAAVHPASYTSVACAGAKTTDVIGGQVAALSPSTSLVSVTIGGNDVGFSGIIETCVLGSTNDCVNAVNVGESYARSTLPGLLDQTYAAIRAHAPLARIVVLGYPDFYELSPWFCIGLSATDHRKIDEGIDLLDSVISAAAARDHVGYADVRAAFTGHEICDGGAKWLHALNYVDIGESYHPTATGQSSGYYPVFARAAG